MTDEPHDRIVVFAGPSLPPRSRPANPVFAWRPPAIAGDAVALAGATPRAVVLIDGFFDEWPAIRHNELLVLIATGIPVIGGASMGALRAAELHSLGMIGVGKIFAAYARGLLDGDDEVAVLHGPADLEWAPLTVPLINVRATLWAATRGRVVDVADARLILQHATTTFYKERTWPGLLARLSETGALRADIVENFTAWLPRGEVDLKHLDALACLDKALAASVQPTRPPPPDTLFSAALRNQVSKDPSYASASRARR